MIKEEEILKLNSEGKSNSEIRKILGYSLTTISKYLSKNNLYNNATNLNLLPKILELHNCGKTVIEISNILKISKTTTRKYLVNNLQITPNSKKKRSITKNSIRLNQNQKDLIYGSLLGDMSIDRSKKYYRLAISHGGAQEEYFNHKCDILKNILGAKSKTLRYDKRTKKFYTSLKAKTLSNSIFNEIASNIYINGVKTITIEWLNKLSEKSLAYWFMDDGHCSGTLATNCFSIEEVKLIQKWLKEKYGMETTIQLQNTQPLLYFTKRSKLIFYKLTHKYFLPSMLYKIENWNP